MKKRTRKNSPSKRALGDASLQSVTGGGKEAYFVRVDRETTTGYSSGDDSTDSR